MIHSTRQRLLGAFYRSYTGNNVLQPLNGGCSLSTESATKSGLSYQEVTAPPGSIKNPKVDAPRTALFLHGLLGSGRNWRSFARRLVGLAADNGIPLRVLLVDLRNHGQSTIVKSLHPPHTLEAAAQDVQELIKTELRGELPSIVVGHSLGGKVALELLQQLAAQPEGRGTPRQVWVLDSQPGKVDGVSSAVDSVAHIIETIKSIPLPVPSRQWLYTHLQPKGITPGTVQWLGSNLVGKEGSLYWNFNIQGAAAMYHSYCLKGFWPLLERPPPGSTLHVVRAEQSDRWTPEMLETIANCVAVNEKSRKAGDAVGTFRLHLLPKAGHWLHSDNPDGLLDMLLPAFIDKE